MSCRRQSLLDHITVQLAPRAADELWFGSGQVIEQFYMLSSFYKLPHSIVIVKLNVNTVAGQTNNAMNKICL